MDRSPIDVETLTRIANELFSASPSTPGPAEIPSAAPAAGSAQGFDAQGIDTSRGLPGPTVGGATFSPSAPPSGPAFGRPVSPEAPFGHYGSDPSRLAPAPGPDVAAHPQAFNPRAFDPQAFDPYALPGFNPIPHVAEGFELAALGPLDPKSSLQAFSPPTNVPGLSAAPGSPSPTFDIGGPGLGGLGLGGSGLGGFPPADLPSAAAFGPDAFGHPASAASFAPSSSPRQPAFGRAVSPEAPNGYGTGQPRFGAMPTFETASFETKPPLGLDGFDDLSIASFLDPTNIPGFSTAPSSAPAAGALHSLPPGTQARSIDRPTPTAFQFTDAPHLGEFPEESILRAQINPTPAAPHPVTPGVGSSSAPADAGDFTPTPSPSFYFLNDGMDYFANDVPKLPRPSATPFNADAVRADFPILKQRVHGHPLIWLDNGATTQKPQAVIDRISSFYENENSNINRSAHELAARATDAYEDARKTVQRFINAPTVEELVFVRGTTEGINFVAQSFGRRFIRQGDEIVLTHAEHHANIVPWYLLAKEVGATLRVVPFDDHGDILLDEYEKLLNDRVKIVAMTHVSNALGTVLPAKAMVEMAHRHGIPVLVDGAQSISHMPIDVQDIDCDFFVFSGHKVFAPTGIGTVYGKKALLDQMPPWQGGGNMIKDVTFEKITFQPAPGRFEAGTGNIADAVGLGEAFKYLERLGMTNIAQHEHALLDYATQRLAPIKGLTIIGTAKEKAGVISFLLKGKDPVEVGKALNQKGIAVRAGHHCALPILRRYGVEATVRPAFAMYNTFEDADRLAEAVREIAGS